MITVVTMNDVIETSTLEPATVNGDASVVETPKTKRGRGRPRKKVETAAVDEVAVLTNEELALLGRLMLMASDAGKTPEEYINEVVKPLFAVYTKTTTEQRLIY